MTFVKFNDRILDKEQQVREQILIKSHIMTSLNDLLENYGFKKQHSHFISEDLNLKARIVFEKAFEEEAV